MYNIWMIWDLLKMVDVVTICNYLRYDYSVDVVPRLKMSGAVHLLALCAWMACRGTTLPLPIIN
jgi:hypothetical protein